MLLGSLVANHVVVAEEASEEEIQRLRDEVTEREVRIQQINEQIQGYDAVIQEKEAEIDSLQNDLAILENSLAKAELDLQVTELEIDTVDHEIRLLDLEIAEQAETLARRQELLEDLVRAMAEEGDVSPLQIVFGSETFSEMLEDFNKLQTVQDDLRLALVETQSTRESLDLKRTSKDEKRLALKELQDELESEQARLEDQQGAKELLVYETAESEEAYRSLVYELKQEQEYVDQELSNLQDAIDQKILDEDLLGDSSLLTYPVTSYVLTTRFHDPTYPFRYLFEHSGLDMAAPLGTPVKSAAPGYVAFARTGRMYGNYVMVIHGNGIATLYAHLSSINVDVDEFVGRGEVIGLMGSTGFSTGPHLHFEVRVDGIPVDPFGYLVK